MKFIRKIAEWFSKQYDLYASRKLKFELVDDFPEVIPEKKILVLSEGYEPDSLAFKCPCGCNSDIYLNLLEDAEPRWNFIITKNGNITISPSIWRKIDCRSHFFIRDGKIEWVFKTNEAVKSHR